jgi:hypothetical protein
MLTKGLTAAVTLVGIVAADGLLHGDSRSAELLAGRTLPVSGGHDRSCDDPGRAGCRPIARGSSVQLMRWEMALQRLSPDLLET